MSAKKSDKQNQKGARRTASEKERLLAWYRDMLLIRRFEEKAAQLYGMGKIGGFCHLYNGQEAVAVGMYSALEPQDTIVTAYRDHGHMLACGMDPREVMAELTGRVGGCSKGKGGSMHMFSREKNFFGGHGIVGAQVPLGAGLAFAHKYKNDGGVSVVYFGDGAANQGQVYETMNMAALWKLPVLFVIENNHYAMGTALSRACAGELSRRGEGYGIEGRVVDGMDIEAVSDAATKAVAHARSGKGPLLLEMRTYRYRGHSMSDPAKYRSREEVDRVRNEQDPIDKLRARIEERNLADAEAFKEIDEEIKQIIKETESFALESPEPDASELWTDILKMAS